MGVFTGIYRGRRVGAQQEAARSDEVRTCRGARGRHSDKNVTKIHLNIHTIFNINIYWNIRSCTNKFEHLSVSKCSSWECEQCALRETVESLYNLFVTSEIFVTLMVELRKPLLAVSAT